MRHKRTKNQLVIVEKPIEEVATEKDKWQSFKVILSTPRTATTL